MAVLLPILGSILLQPSSGALAQDADPDVSGCVVGTATSEQNIGAPNAEGITQKVQFGDASEKAAFNFTVSGGGDVKARTVAIYVGDQWYDLDLALYPKGTCRAAAQWQVRAAGVSERQDRRVLQFVRPDEEFIQGLAPGDYRLVVAHKYFYAPSFATDFDPRRDFTVRIAVTPNVCALNPPNDQPHPAMFDPNLDDATRARYADAHQRRDDALYQAGMTVQPDNPGPSSLMTFNGLVSPPYTDLFDFSWAIDGAPVPGADQPILQMPAAQLSKGGPHTVSVTVKGAREYQDPTDSRYNHLPLDGGTLTVSCDVTVSS